MTRSREVLELTGIRGILALWIVVGHWSTTIPISFRPLHQDLWNVQAVGAFVCLSGFVIALVLAEKDESYPVYILKRLLRLYPVYIFVLALSIVLLPFTAATLVAAPPSTMQAARLAIIASSESHFGLDLAAHLLMLHGIVPISFDPRAAYAFVGQAWSISLEWQFYLIAPALLSAIAARRRIPIVVAALAALAFLGHWLGMAFIGNNLLPFGIGIGSYYLWRLPGRPGGVKWRLASRIAIGTLLVAVVITRADWLIGMTCWCLVMHCLLTDGGPEHAVCAFLGNRVVRHLGRISYSLYLIHFTVLVIALRVVELSNLQEGIGTIPAALVLLIVTLAGSIAAAQCLNVWVENPGNALASRWSRSISPIVVR
jgi:peptidoglycan/LPS O-acetylase OafA/YrhL